ncbi:hypothetical protein FJT64_018459 [Amphibalanus amphitrite]|uniref:Uncharacterized protein n=1 Tax=Amphibalanus amphitrite TaxID=1232801 RepID=A0A6A4WST5_AMPAM|nr:hypothetical protein FJT64_018459 [Amphibalanus amphitrite]
MAADGDSSELSRLTMPTCCRCVELRRGCVAIGVWLLIVYGVAGLALTAAALYCQRRGWREATALAASAPLPLLAAAFHVLLVLGAARRRPPLLLAWLVGCGALFTAQSAALAVGVFLLAAGSLWAVLASMAALATLQTLCWYWFWAVRCLYLELVTVAARARWRAADGVTLSPELATEPRDKSPVRNSRSV